MNTLSDWLETYYPSTATDSVVQASGQEGLVKHSLRKWKGIRKDILERYDLKLYGALLLDAKGNGLSFSGEACALCVSCSHPSKAHASAAAKPLTSAHKVDCTRCALYAYLGRPCWRGGTSEYGKFIHTGDPEPMVAALEATLRAIQEKRL